MRFRRVRAIDPTAVCSWMMSRRRRILRFDPVGDARPAQNNDVIEWDAGTLAPRGRRNFHGKIRSLAISPDSELLAILTFGGVFVYEMGARATAEEVWSFHRDGDNRMSHQRRDDPVQVGIGQPPPHPISG